MSRLPRLRRFAPLLLAAFLLPVVAAPAAATDDLTVAQAERAVVDRINARRASLGLVALRVDTRVAAIARARSVDMAVKAYFDHRQPDGRYAWDLLSAAGISWQRVGETLAWNTSPTLRESAGNAADQWRNSPGHDAILNGTDYNYIGLGLAVDATGKRIWTAVVIKGPDRTGAVGSMYRVTAGTGTTSRPVTATWRGADVRLQVLTAGLRNFDVARRVDGGTWQTIVSGTTATSRTMTLATRHRYEFRVRARDNAGNVGAWSAPIAVAI